MNILCDKLSIALMIDQCNVCIVFGIDGCLTMLSKLVSLVSVVDTVLMFTYVVQVSEPGVCCGYSADV